VSHSRDDRVVAGEERCDLRVTMQVRTRGYHRDNVLLGDARMVTEVLTDVLVELLVQLTVMREDHDRCPPGNCVDRRGA